MYNQFKYGGDTGVSQSTMSEELEINKQSMSDVIYVMKNHHLLFIQTEREKYENGIWGGEVLNIAFRGLKLLTIAIPNYKDEIVANLDLQLLESNQLNDQPFWPDDPDEGFEEISKAIWGKN